MSYIVKDREFGRIVVSEEDLMLFNKAVNEECRYTGEETNEAPTHTFVVYKNMEEVPPKLYCGLMPISQRTRENNDEVS